MRIKLQWRFLAGADVVLTPKVVADEFGESLGVVSYHVRDLHQHRILQLVKRVARRSAYEHRYRLRDPERVAGSLWGASARLLRVADVDPLGPSDATVVVDAIGLADIRALTDRYLADLADVSRQVRTRIGAHGTTSLAPTPLQAAPADALTYRVAILLGGDHDR